ncbi:MAG: serine/threonine-protein kinase [Aureliella sp.]
MTNNPDHADSDPKADELASQLKLAAAYQSELAGQGKPHGPAEVLREFPVLHGQQHAELALAYQATLLAHPQERRESRERVLQQVPHLKADLIRQFDFADAIRMQADTVVAAPADSGADPGPEVPSMVGRFDMGPMVGQGGTGMVFQAYDTLLDRDVAIKVPRVEVRRDAAAEQRLVREARIASQLRHPNLAELLDIAEHGGARYLVSRWANRGSLQQLLAAKQAPMSEEAALWLMQQITSGLSYCHRKQVYHLDLKPGNILFSTESQEGGEIPSELPGVPLITDFGIALFATQDRTVSFSHTGLGTPMYMAPEQISGDVAALGAATDVFACGLIFYELLAGKHPLADASIADAVNGIRTGLIPDLPNGIQVSPSAKAILFKCLQDDPSRRYEHAEALNADLERVLGGGSVTPRKRSWASRLQSFSKRNESIDQAAFVSLGLNGSLFTGFFFILFALALKIWPEFDGDPVEYTLDVFKLFVFPHGPMIINSVLVLRGLRRLHLINTVLSAILVAMVSVTLISGDSPLRIYEGHLFTFAFLHLTVLGLSLCMLAAHMLAMPAWVRLNAQAKSRNGRSMKPD